MAYIYKITNNLSGNFYIGKTTNPIEVRYSSHIQQANKNAKTILHKAIKSAGVENFTIEIIEECEEELLNEREIFYIKELSPHYNMTPGGEGGSTTHSKKWITDGAKDCYINETEALPEGWAYGRSNCVFNDTAKQQEFNSRVDRKAVGKRLSEKWKNGEIKFDEVRLKEMSDRVSGDRNPSKRPEVASKISQKQKENFAKKKEQGVKVAEHLHKRIQCPHCPKDGIISNMKRWHFNNCKAKNDTN